MSYINVKNLTIEFPGVRALDDVSFSIEQGSSVALCGENGAGKSTLGKILAGVYSKKQYTGDIEFKGKSVDFKSTLDAEKAGIVIVHQELNQIAEMTVAENVFLGDMPTKRGVIDQEALYRKTKEFLLDVGLDVDPNTKMRNLTISKRQMIEIATALSRNPEVVVFDEATSSLTNAEAEILFAIMKRLREKGITMIYVTHKLDEIFQVCDHIVVLKDGKMEMSGVLEGMTKEDIIHKMIGRDLCQMYPERPVIKLGEDISQDEVVLKIENWSVYDGKDVHRKVVDQVNFELYKGEILGLYGLMGAGRTELVNSIFEGRAIHSTGQIYIDGKPVVIRSPKDAIKNGMALVTEDRKKTGLVLGLSVRENISLASLGKIVNSFHVLDFGKEREYVNKSVNDLSIKVPDVMHLARQLSGGNQQKVVLSKWLLSDPKILIMDEPTRGIDVGTKVEIYKILRSLADKGISILMVSSEMPEVIGVSDRILVMKEGKFVEDISGFKATEELLAKCVLGGN